MKKNLPVYDFVIDDSVESGVKAISIVADPAFGSGLITFSKEKPQFIVFQGEQKKKQICAGFLVLPDVPIYRMDKETGQEYYGVFKPEMITKIIEKYHEEMLSNKVNLNHNDNNFIDAFMIEDYQVDSKERVADLEARGLKNEHAFMAWYGAMKIKDPEVFQAIETSGKATGFSVEAYLEKFMKNFDKEVINQIINNKVEIKMTKINKTIKEKILAIFTEVENFQRALVPELAFDIEWAKKDEPVNKVVVDENGNESLQPVGQGEFTTEKGIVAVDAASNLIEVRPLPKEPKVPEISGSTSGTTSGNTTQVSGATAVVDNQPAAAKVQVPEVTGVTSGKTGNMEVYPWDECVAEQTKRYGSKSAAERVCGYIRSKNMSADDLTEAELQELLGADFKSGSTNCASGSTSGATSTKKSGLEESVASIVSGGDGDYIIAVHKEGGKVTEATVTSQRDLIPQSQDAMPSGMSSNFSTQVKAAFAKVTELKLKVTELEAKMKEPISDPILAPEKKVLSQAEFNKLTPFEKIKYNKGW